MTNNVWNRILNRHLNAWAGKGADAFPFYDFAGAEASGMDPRDAAQEAIDAS